VTTAPTQPGDVANLLTTALSATDPALLPVDVRGVGSNHDRTTSHSEIITVQLGDGSTRVVFAKFAPDGEDGSPTFRWGVRYEAAVYEHVLTTCHATVPKFYGSAYDAEAAGTWLFTEHLADAVRIAKSPDPSAVGSAATWLGRFHRELGERVSGEPIRRNLRAHDAAYFDGWFRHARAFVDVVHTAAPWSAAIVERRREIAGHLLGAEPTVVHGDFFSKNVLGTSRGVFPVDWESAATGAGEVDLATFVQGWGDDVAAACIDAYCTARWDAHPPRSFRDAFAAAQIYALMRTASFEGWSRSTRGQQRALRQLHDALQQLGAV
jgi:aminoglycoside phosphotransferase (APT) family kinase protein